MTDTSDARPRGSEEIVFLGRRRIRGIGRRALLDPALASGAGTPAAALALLRELEEADGVPRVLMGSIPFDPAEPAHLVVPERVVPVEPSSSPAPSGTASVPDAPDDEHYRVGVRRILAEINAGLARKVVLARTFDVVAGEPIDTEALLTAFAARNPSSYAFHVPLATGGTLVGASPELLVAVDADVVRSHPLAGTAARVEDAEADAAARAALLESAKDREEHAILVDGLAGDLAPLTVSLDVPAAPTILATDRLWHLGTPLVGRLRPGVSALDVAYAVHPTAAVCGIPVGIAADLVATLEAAPRGPYAGLVGWMDSRGAGEWAIALRCATVDGAHARVYAGAGVIAGSDPDAEHAETAAKLRTALHALADVVDVAPRSLVRA